MVAPTHESLAGLRCQGGWVEKTDRVLMQGWDLQRDKEWKDMRSRVSWPESNEVMAHGVWDV